MFVRQEQLTYPLIKSAAEQKAWQFVGTARERVLA